MYFLPAGRCESVLWCACPFMIIYRVLGASKGGAPNAMRCVYQHIMLMVMRSSCGTSGDLWPRKTMGGTHAPSNHFAMKQLAWESWQTLSACASAHLIKLRSHSNNGRSAEVIVCLLYKRLFYCFVIFMTASDDDGQPNTQ